MGLLPHGKECGDLFSRPPTFYRSEVMKGQNLNSCCVEGATEIQLFPLVRECHVFPV